MFTFGCYHFSWFHTCWRWWLWWLIVLCVNAFDISVHLMLTTAIRNTPATITTTRCTQEIFQPKFLSLFFAVVSLFFFSLMSHHPVWVCVLLLLFVRCFSFSSFRFDCFPISACIHSSIHRIHLFISFNIFFVSAVLIHPQLSSTFQVPDCLSRHMRKPKKKNYIRWLCGIIRKKRKQLLLSNRSS